MWRNDMKRGLYIKLPEHLHAELVRRYLAGETTVTLAEAYGTCPSTVGRVLHQMGVEVRRRRMFMGDKGDKVREMLSAGCSVRDIAREVGTCTTWIYQNFDVPRQEKAEVVESPRKRARVRAHKEALSGLRDQLRAFRNSGRCVNHEKVDAQIEALEYFL
jgi:transposase-like protein